MRTTDALLTQEEENKQKTPGKVNSKRGSKEVKYFAKSRKKDLQGLLTDGTFLSVKEPDIKSEPRIFGSRFVD